MKKGALLLNLARGEVIDVEAVAEALRSGRLGGCAVDVYSREPEEAATDSFETPLQNCPNTILTPHIGGSTIEAQREIGVDVARKLATYINTGSTDGAVNFPQILPPAAAGRHRLLHVHPNKPGMLRAINNILSDYNNNISAQVLATSKNIGYLLVDLDSEVSKEIMSKIKGSIKETIKARLLY
jgi:D-3-phosphoglycerate dehydrogenase / 2-oxoglutarate reductase